MIHKRIAILNSGGDCPGLNAVISGVVRAATLSKWEVVGFLDGFEGLLPPGEYVTLNPQNTEGILRLGGTMLGTTNRRQFMAKIGAGEKTGMEFKFMESALAVLKSMRIEGLIVVGGDGSLRIAQQISDAGFPVIGVPKTIDNDLESTSTSFGFDSAVECVVHAMDRLHTTASSHKRVMVLEVMGRDTGWIALHGGLAGGADIILIPEIPFDYEKVAEAVRQREVEGALSTLIVAAEGAVPQGQPSSNRLAGRHSKRLFGRRLLRSSEWMETQPPGIGGRVAYEVAKRTGKETRTCVLGHLQRGGAPTALDRNLGICFGIEAVRLVEQKKFGRMVSYKNNMVFDVAMADAVHQRRRVQPDSQMLAAARAMNIVFGDEGAFPTRCQSLEGKQKGCDACSSPGCCKRPD